VCRVRVPVLVLFDTALISLPLYRDGGEYKGKHVFIKNKKGKAEGFELTEKQCKDLFIGTNWTAEVNRPFTPPNVFDAFSCFSDVLSFAGC